MADPVSNLEIEDVLSSIRRLVSDEARTPIRELDEVAFVSEVPPEPIELEEESVISGVPNVAANIAPALVLTAELRVEDRNEAENSEAPAETALEANDSPEPKPLLILRNDDALEESVADHSSQDAAVPVLDGTLEFANPSEDALQSTQEAADKAVRGDVLATENAEVVQASADPLVLEPSDAFSQNDEPRTIEEKIAALESLINHTETDFEPDGAEDGANAARRENALPWEDSFEVVEAETGLSFPDPDQASQTVQFDDGATAFEQARSEAVETAQSELENIAAETLLDDDGQGAILDEEALRDMVAEIVRQELQGPLGERITRNVRKLVRREIYRALAANELD